MGARTRKERGKLGTKGKMYMEKERTVGMSHAARHMHRDKTRIEDTKYR